MANPIRVVIADDSVVYRSQIRAALSHYPWIEVVAAASNGRLALERLSQTQVDLLILDLEMPELNGIETLTEMKKQGQSCKVLVFSSASKRGADITLEALRLGASDFVTKPGADAALGHSGDPTVIIRDLLEPKLTALFPQDSMLQAPPTMTPADNAYPKILWDLFQPKLLVIGCSTGGPNALERIFSMMPGPYRCPIVIVQHMPPIFTASLAERIGKLTGVKAIEAINNDVLTDNTIYVAPGDFHLKLSGTASRTVMALDKAPLINSVRPAVDPLFETAASIYKDRLLAVVLTGMGADGKIGAQAVKKQNGAVVIQDKESSVVFGMPGAVYECGAYDKISSIGSMASLLGEKIQVTSGGVARAN